MSTTANAVKPAKGGWAKKLGIAAGVLVALVVVAYFVGTSAWCLKSIILPKVGKAMNATVTADDAAISPFSAVKITGLKVQTTGAEPLVTVREASVRYSSLFDLIGGKINVDEIAVSGVQVNVVKNADGTSNLDPLLKGQAGANAQTKSGGPAPQVYLKKLLLSDSTVRYTQTDAKGNKTTAEIAGINVTIEELGNGKTASLNLKSDLAFSQTVSGASTGTLQTIIKGDLKLGLDAQLAPGSMSGGVDMAVAQATGLFKDAAGLNANLQSDWTPANIKGIALKFSQGGKGLAVMSVSGPFDAAKQEGKLKLEVTGVDRQLLNLALNLAGMANAVDFNQTAISAGGEIELSQGGKKITTSGSVKAARLSITQDKQTSPEMDLQVGYNVSVDLPAKTALIQTLSLAGVQKGAEIIRGNLSKPMPINWGKTGGAVDESAFDLAVNNLDLADWRAFAAGTDPAGKLNLKLNLLSLNAGQKLVVDLNAGLADFTAKFGSNKIDRADVTLVLKSATEGFAKTEISALDLRLAHQKQPVLNVSGSGSVNSTNLEVNLQTTAEVFLTRLSTLAGLPALQLSQGSLTFKGGIVQKNLNPAQTNNPPLERSVTGTLRLADMTGKYDTYTFDRFGVAADCDVQVKNDQATIRKLAAAFSQSGAPGGKAEVTGQYDLAKTNGQLVVRVSDVNENLLKSFAAMLAPNKLERVNLSTSLETKFDVKGDMEARGNVLVANLVITDPAGQLPKTPMTADLKLDVGMKNKLAEIRAFNGAIKQGELNGGSFEVKGSFDTVKTNGQFSVKVVDLNQNALRPFLPAAKDAPALETVSINVTVNSKIDLAGDTSVTGLVQVANLLFKDPKNQMPKEPLAVQMNLDGSFKQQVLDLRALALQLTPTQRGANLVSLSGKLNLAKSNAITGNLSLKADSLDLTYYYNLFANRPAEAATTSTANVSSNVEPAAMTLPLSNFTFDASVGRLYLLDMAVSNFLATLRINGGRVDLSTFQAVINGAPASGRLAANLGVPGYTYDTAFNLTRLPLNPIATSFMPYAKDGLRGDMTLAWVAKGAGVTGKSLRENLTGGMSFDVTNGALVVKNLIKPDTSKKPTGAAAFINVLTGILDPLLNTVGAAVGMPNLVAEPFNISRMDMQFGGGNFTLRDFTLSNSKIIVGSRGAIPIADDLMASPLNLPVEISLSRELAARFNVANAPTNATHVKLPDFVLVKGTLGKSETKLNTKALAGTALSEIGKRVGGDAGGLLQGVGNILGGGTKAVTNAPPANNPPGTKPATNAPVNNLLNDLFKPKK